jgi:O-methyltransferase
MSGLRAGFHRLRKNEYSEVVNLNKGFGKRADQVTMPNKTAISQKYIALLKNSLLDELYIENEVRIIATLATILNEQKVTAASLYDVGPYFTVIEHLRKQKLDGTILILNRRNADGTFVPIFQSRNFTALAHTLIGRKRLDNIQNCIECIIDENVPGDLIETGIWRGGATIFMRGVLAAYGITDRVVWAADSFEGLPPPTHPQDGNVDLSKTVFPFLAVSLEQVCELFKRYDLLDGQVKFLKGWFKDTLHAAPIEKLAVLRLDGDLYESTIDALNALYEKVSDGGFVIIDDYYSCPPCKLAVDDFRSSRDIADAFIQIDKESVFWRKCSTS